MFFGNSLPNWGSPHGPSDWVAEPLVGAGDPGHECWAKPLPGESWDVFRCFWVPDSLHFMYLYIYIYFITLFSLFCCLRFWICWMVFSQFASMQRQARNCAGRRSLAGGVKTVDLLKFNRPTPWHIDQIECTLSSLMALETGRDTSMSARYHVVSGASTKYFNHFLLCFALIIVGIEYTE